MYQISCKEIHAIMKPCVTSNFKYKLNDTNIMFLKLSIRDNVSMKILHILHFNEEIDQFLLEDSVYFMN